MSQGVSGKKQQNDDSESKRVFFQADAGGLYRGHEPRAATLLPCPALPYPFTHFSHWVMYAAGVTRNAV
ncbi:hypothetical protein Rcae01_03591 [Novipirellula caenicola]|uniref:Uncharacterized protein n=1 Tax=Novipirellula caenicola TaxID=1536901 RepID=A0ABP9VSJ1_9BACT